MANVLPEFDEYGDLPVGVYQATLPEILDRFGKGSLDPCEIQCLSFSS